LRRRSSLSRGNDHLAVRRRHAAGGVQPFYGGAHIRIYYDFTFHHFGTQQLRKFVVINIAPRREERLDGQVRALREFQ